MLNINLNNHNLTRKDIDDLTQILSMQDEKISEEVEQIWYLMDKIWDQMGCDNKKLDWKKIGKYYSHPVWLLNGIFIENHELSIKIRESIAEYIAQQGFINILDYGGGFGTLARHIAKKCSNSTIHIYEPHPSNYGMECIKEFHNISFVDTIYENYYDCIVSTDVLEHVPNPLQTFFEFQEKIKPKGQLIIANCFYPCIKCHLPQNFHFRYTFNYFAERMGVKKIGKIANTHAVVFEKQKQYTKLTIKKWEILLSKFIFFLLEIIRPIARKIYHSIKKHKNKKV